MTAALIIQGLVIVALVIVVLLRERDHDARRNEDHDLFQRLIINLDQRNRDERAELATRIQHPQVIPRRERPADDTETSERPARTQAALASVGQIRPQQPPQNGEVA